MKYLLWHANLLNTVSAGFIALLLSIVPFSTALSQEGARFDKLEAGEVVYYRVKVTKVSPRSISILHSKGIAQVMLEDLSPELQERFGYNTTAAEVYQKELDARNKEAREARLKTVEKRTRKTPENDKSERILNRFGTPPILQERVDLRSKFRELELITKSQGRRPSCSVFAVVSALEFQNALVAGKPEKLSEEYLIWATRKTLGQAQATSASGTYPVDEELSSGDADAGFHLIEVVQALRSYGIPLSEQMRNTYGKSMAKIQEPSEELINIARTRRKVYSYLITGRDSVAQIDGIIHALNEAVPVVIGIGWPHYKSLMEAPILSGQKPRSGYGHAVTVVGYKCETGQYKDILFAFKNSYGRRWGVNGYGYATYPYLQKHLNSAVFLDVKP